MDRSKFESWFLRVHGGEVGPRAGEIYFDDTATFAWGGWQASRRELEIELPQQSGVNLDWNQAIRYCHQAIKAAGVKVK